MRIGLATTALAAAVVLTSCAATGQKRLTPGVPRKTVYVVHHGGLHTGLTVKRSDIPPGHWPASTHFNHSNYIEVGWGDDDGYRKPLTSGIALKALLGDQRTVLFAEGFSEPVRLKYRDPKFTLLAVDLSDAGIRQLCDYIQQAYAVDRNEEPVRLGNGWYRARGTYSAFNTCNTWIARGLRQAGCPIDGTFCLTAGQLLGRVRPFARDLSAKR